MNQVNKNEVDLMLRALARRVDELHGQDGPTPEAETRSRSAHLDADELNSFAEGVLPERARVRYMEHLADCESCRGIIVELTQATGAAAPYPTRERQDKESFWQKLAALFSPSVLRYAVPALALTAVIGISLLALRQKPGTEFVAQNQPGDVGQPSVAGKSETPVAPPSNAAPSATQRPDLSANIAEVGKEKPKSPASEGVLADAPITAGQTVTTSGLERDAKAASKADESQPSYAPEPKSAAAPPPPPRAAVNDADTMKMKSEQMLEKEARDRRQEEYQIRPREESGPNRSRTERNNNAPLNNRQVDGLLASRGGPRKDKNDSNSSNGTDTRTINGRSFRREGNAWVDTAYESSRATTKVARGSEQFRALIADEPGIGAIASQLSGEVIVVWKGRAYRIR